MGCDIHGFVEQKRYKSWYCVADLHLPRSYDTFEALAGVRGHSLNAVVPPRGIPTDIGFTVENAYTIWAVEEPETYWDSEIRVVDEDTAEKWVDQGHSQVWQEGNIMKITHPDWHTEHWLQSSELEDGLSQKSPDEYWATLAMMKRLERSVSDVRFVFWFDN